MWKRRLLGRRGGAVKWHSWQMTSPVSQSPLLSTMICHLHFWHFSSHYQITLTEWYFLILPALEHTKNNGLHMVCTLFLCFPLSLSLYIPRKHPVMKMRHWKSHYIQGSRMASQSFKLSSFKEGTCHSKKVCHKRFATWDEYFTKTFYSPKLKQSLHFI